MFIPEFWAGVMATIGVELVALVVAAAVKAFKK